MTEKVNLIPAQAVEALVDTIRASVVGGSEAIEGPFGRRKITYADYTASGKSLSFIEDYIRSEVLTRYANTHTEVSGTGLQTTIFREEARSIIRRAVKATDEDAVIFCGSGATGAVHKLISIMNLRLPHELDARYGLSRSIPPEERPVVFVGPYEHHSNEIPWRESIADVVVIEEGPRGGVDLAHLTEELRKYAARPLKIGSFSAASNVTGILTDIDEVTACLHAHGALSFWDFAAAAPYVDIEMNGDGGKKDAVFISPHKFIGGPGSPGILVVKKALCTNAIPSEPGGGTVAWVNPGGHRFVDDVERREEGGTPEIIGSIRAGLVFQLKEAVGVETIRARETDFIKRAMKRWEAHPNIVILGDTSHDRISIVSLMIRHGDRLLHWGFCAALLNDLFGIQSRGGCSCAGPYGHKLLGVAPETSAALETLALGGAEGIKPGWVRINFNYFIGEEVFDFLVRAVEFLAEHGWKLLPHYSFDPKTGMWRHRAGTSLAPMSLHDISYRQGRMEFAAEHADLSDAVLPSYLEEADRLVASPMQDWQPREPGDPELPPEFEALRWFVLPDEVFSEP